ncbi:MAG: DUF4760 domain-containing protein [Vitreimonas sp.]
MVPLEPLTLSDWIGHSLTAASVAVATIALMYGAWLQRQLARRAHTIEILLSHDVNGELAQMLERVDGRIGAAPPPTRESADEELKRVLNFYEFICAAAFLRSLDRQLLVDTQRGRILRLYHYSRGLIAELRQFRKNRRIFDRLEWFARTQLHYEKWIASAEGGAAFPAASQ